ncbi:uncharacterized protein Z520_02461 [Fonsecaea multimorphosa CBS 102226]|uniref:EthD domain-containing protein n=1 Tax=Fonsecaea multimorphosa CBS 102226 TaxID=1442371 RepID=A0A0D2K8B6_9EURO|nr:uncharacterized protein Z520_02461 [Fonsecaea multimorphosa CBS 102226]KIY02323.1 hypothetical protein Z520_02461 [Fonsecaea multimorphosa CBS 102226]OAL28967.1 hypothetical protein AYO22_02403 [Fonsecaea multimorphosa]
MTVNATVLYPTEADATFDLDYYLKTHMPLVSKNWSKYGLKSWQVIQYQTAPDGSKPYNIGALLTWESADGLKNALAGEEAATVFGDVPNFSNKSPIFIAGDIVGTS